MSLQLLSQLEAKVATTLDSLEILRMEMDELKEENAALKDEKYAWEARLGQLLGKFSELEPAADTAAAEETQEETQQEEADTNL
ncbi:MAG: cell division protein ZapB [Pseudomonadaceae bacterium]|nr:cell division protein ZapB [Pseudomonadaceae bacterium]